MVPRKVPSDSYVNEPIPFGDHQFIFIENMYGGNGIANSQLIHPSHRGVIRWGAAAGVETRGKAFSFAPTYNPGPLTASFMYCAYVALWQSASDRLKDHQWGVSGARSKHGGDTDIISLSPVHPRTVWAPCLLYAYRCRGKLHQASILPPP